MPFGPAHRVPVGSRSEKMLTNEDFDNTIRWQPGERLETLFERACDDPLRTNAGTDPAVITDDGVTTFRELDERANQTARHLIAQGVRPGERVGLLITKSVHTYIAMLAILKANAAYVPLDASFPEDRIVFICGDAEVTKVVTLSMYEQHLSTIDATLIALDSAAGEIAAQDTARLTAEERGRCDDNLCYIVYTSGSTGNPKGVAIEHPSICNFVAVAAETYGMLPTDRCYQGMTIAFDFSVEETWVPLVVGAALVPGRNDVNMLGADLAEFLERHEVTALCCVPTLLATIEKELPGLRFLLVSGEACPRDLVSRWHRDGRVFINAYGPTEASVTATLTTVHPDKPVTIGGPLATYTIVILKQDAAELVEDGGMGEICIAGIALARGYVNRDDLTEKAFIPDFIGIENNPSGRIYRTGDLGRINGDGEIEFHGRIDTQVKIRGYRIELTEIESVFMEMPQVAFAAVDTYEPVPGVIDLVAYHTLNEGFDELPADQLSELLRSRLPGYMIPAYVERLETIPLMPSQKADRKKLPPPAGPRFSAAAADIIEPRTATEVSIAEVLREAMQLETVSVEDHFFHDLGAHSLLMTRLSADLKQRFPGRDLSMRDIYLHPTVAKLAEFIDEKAVSSSGKSEREPYHVPSDLAYYGCGFFQLAFYAVYIGFIGTMIVEWVDWVLSSATPYEVYGRSVLGGLRAFAIFAALPIAAKWILVGRWKPDVFPVWGLRYFRFWLVKTLIQTNPILIFAGTPVYNVYLRLLGARIGRGAVIQSQTFPIATDLVSIGDNTILRKESILMSYKAEGGSIHMAPVTIGSNVYVGEAALIDIGTTMEDGTQLGHASSLHAGQTVPAGAHYHGSPAIETTADYNPLPAGEISLLRKIVYSAVVAAGAFLLVVPTAILAVYYLFPSLFGAQSGIELVVTSLPDVSLRTTLTVFLATAVFFLGTLAAGLIVIGTVPRLLNLFIEKDRRYPLYGRHYYLFQTIRGLSNSDLFNTMFGDSSYIVYYLKYLGYRVSSAVQTGSNFGTDQSHDNPFLCEIGRGTMVSDGLAMINAHMSSSSFTPREVVIGDNNFIGNNVHYPPDGKTGANVLIATKCLVPIDGPVRADVGLLGSPSFEIPRSVNRDQNINCGISPEEQARLLRAKNAHGLFAMASFLFIQWAHLFMLVMACHWALTQYTTKGIWFVLATFPLFGLFSILYFAFVSRWSLGPGRMPPVVCSIYDRQFWKVEHYWKRNDTPLKTLFSGTPFKNTISRLLGVRVGRKVFDDGAFATEKHLVEIGDYCTLNDLSVLQSHSLEDGVFKADHVRIEAGCTVGANSFVHYGAHMAENAVLGPDSFLMKGETVASGSSWEGNPAREI